MRPDVMRATAPVRLVLLIRNAVACLSASPASIELPSHEQIVEARRHRRHIVGAPHLLAAGGRPEVLRLLH